MVTVKSSTYELNKINVEFNRSATIWEVEKTTSTDET